MSTYFVYILTNKANRALYIGVTNDLSRRMYEHKNALINGFTKKYHINKLVYNECFSTMKDAILREKQLKAWRREKKNALIESTNPSWDELSI